MPPLSCEPSVDSSQSKVSRTHSQMLFDTPTRCHTSGISTPGRQFSSGYNTTPIESDFANATESDSQALHGDTTAGIPRGKSLRSVIRRALQKCYSNGKERSFLPEDKLAEIMTPQNVQHYLSNSGNTFRQDHSKITEHICGQRGRSNARRTSRRIFAILLLMQEPHLLIDFIEQGIDDSNLPLSIIRTDSSSSESESSTDEDEDDYLARSTIAGPIVIQRFRQWTCAQRQTFYNNQWRVQVPIFLEGRRTSSSHPVHTFDKDVILPWTEYEEHYNGLSDVSRVKVHSAHCHLPAGVDQSFALKSLKPIVPQYGEQEFRLEVKALLKVKPRPHLEVGLLTSFEYRKRFHLLFRWADGGNLRDLWTKHPRPDFNHSRVCWMAQQLYGLAYGVDGIHNTKMTASEVETVSPLSPDVAHQSFDVAHSPVSEVDEGRDYGRHGDIKPENVLWFKEDASHPEFGILKLSDFGLTTFHRALTTGVKAKDVRVTNTYSAPEREIEETLSRPFDVWSLGCIFLEFVTWIMLGSKGNKHFEARRLRDGGDRNHRISVDNFFTVLRQDETTYKAEVKPSVLTWINGLKKRSECSQYLSELLDYIQHKMLLVRKEDRDNSKTVSDRLKEMLEQCKRDERYALGGRSTEFHQRKLTAKSKSDEPEKEEAEAGSKRAKRKRSDFQFDHENYQGPASRTRSRLR